MLLAQGSSGSQRPATAAAWSITPPELNIHEPRGCVVVCERGAEESGIDHRVGKFFIASGKAVAMGAPEGFVKIITDGASRVIEARLWGACIGPHSRNSSGRIACLAERLSDHPCSPTWLRLREAARQWRPAHTSDAVFL